MVNEKNTMEQKIEVPQRVLNAEYGSTAADWHQHSNGEGWVYKTAKEAVGKAEGYTKEQIAEYGLHLAHIAAIAKNLPPEPKPEEGK